MISTFFQKKSNVKISVILIVYEMSREALRTLQSLSPQYQQNISPDDYEVIVVDNGSQVPLGEDAVNSIGCNFHYHYIQDAKPSPASAINYGVHNSSGDIVGVLIDGARIVTPGLLHYAELAFTMYDDPTVVSLGWHLGPEPQQKSIAKGYTQGVEDKLLAEINWPDDGYRLFKISSLAGSSSRGCFAPISESNTIFLKRNAYDDIGGYDTDFDLPGGGLVNLDFYRRACERKGTVVVVLLGEGSFHQLHGGVSTNISQQHCAERFQEWANQYKDIRGFPWDCPNYNAEYLGSISPESLDYIAWSARQGGAGDG